MNKNVANSIVEMGYYIKLETMVKFRCDNMGD